MVRTLVEVRDGRITINEDEDKTTVTVDMSRSVDAENAWNRVNELEAQVKELEDSLARMADNFNESQRQLKEARTGEHLVFQMPEGENLEITGENFLKVLARLSQTEEIETEAKRAVETLSDTLGKVGGAVIGPEIREALRWPSENRTESQDAALTEAVRDVRRIIGTPPSS